mmetsp:Transcript_18375/g.48505  ORF Transcript_18375/g.48505 Transcript_18375/m.48505 type:complete len:247 (+) Transcript_18375:69-809(+)
MDTSEQPLLFRRLLLFILEGALSVCLLLAQFVFVGQVWLLPIEGYDAVWVCYLLVPFSLTTARLAYTVFLMASSLRAWNHQSRMVMVASPVLSVWYSLCLVVLQSRWRIFVAPDECHVFFAGSSALLCFVNSLLTFEGLELSAQYFSSEKRGLRQCSEAVRVTRRRGCGGGSKLSNTCTVCLEELLQGEYVASLPCGHVYHAPCIEKWLEGSQKCPLRCPQILDGRLLRAWGGCGPWTHFSTLGGG